MQGRVPELSPPVPPALGGSELPTAIRSHGPKDFVLDASTMDSIFLAVAVGLLRSLVSPAHRGYVSRHYSASFENCPRERRIPTTVDAFEYWPNNRRVESRSQVRHCVYNFSISPSLSYGTYRETGTNDLRSRMTWKSKSRR